MRHSFFFLSLLALLICAMPVQAAGSGKIFPPDRTFSGTIDATGCQNGKVLGWTGDRVACLDPSEGIAIGECTGGTVMTGIVNGEPVCVDATPTIICGEGKAIKKIKDGQYKCIDVGEATPGTVALDCGQGKVLHKAEGKVLDCISTSSLTATCSGGNLLKGIVDGVPDCVPDPNAGTGKSDQPTVFCPRGKIVQSFDSEGNVTCIDPAVVGDVACPAGQSLLRHVNYNVWTNEVIDCKVWDAQPTGTLGWYGKGSSYAYAYGYIGPVGTANPCEKAAWGGMPSCPKESIVVGVDICYENGAAYKGAVLCKNYK